MLESIISGLLQGVVAGLDEVVTALLSMLNFSMSEILLYMPAIANMYDVLQWVALGLVVGIAIVKITKSATGNLTNSKETAPQILARSAIAVVLIYFGNYLLQIVVDLFTYPLSMLLQVDASIGNGIFQQIGSSQVFLVIGLGGMIIALVLVLVLAWNILKLLLEAVERWLVLCVLTYTSPLAYSTFASAETGEIFKKWVSMVLGQCMLVLLNVWSIKLIVNIVAQLWRMENMSGLLFLIVVAVAFARIAQNFDSYLQQLGVNAATTGGSLLDTIAATGKSLGGSVKKSGGEDGSGLVGGYTSSLKNAVKSGNVAKAAAMGGALGAAPAALNKFKNSEKGQEMFKKASEAVGVTSAKSSLENASKAGDAAMKDAVLKGQTQEQANAAGMNAFDSAMKEGKVTTAFGELNGSASAVAKSFVGAGQARKDFASSMDGKIKALSANGSARQIIGNDGSIRNGAGETVSDARTEHGTMIGPNSSLARSIGGSARKEAVAAGVGFESGSQGEKMAVDTIKERGAELSQAIVDGDNVVNNEAVAGNVIKGALGGSTGHQDLDQAISSIDDNGNVPESVGSVSDMKAGNGTVSFSYQAPSYQEEHKGADGSMTMRTVEAPVEVITAKTAAVFEKMPASEQSLYTSSRNEVTGTTYFVKRTRDQGEKFKTEGKSKRRK